MKANFKVPTFFQGYGVMFLLLSPGFVSVVHMFNLGPPDKHLAVLSRIYGSLETQVFYLNQIDLAAIGNSFCTNIEDTVEFITLSSGEWKMEI